MSPTKDRQRAAARARLEREMAARADAAAKRRQRRRTISLAAAAVVLVGVVVLVVVEVAGGGSGSPAAAGGPSASPTPGPCQWYPNPDPSASASAAPNPNLKDVGTPPTTGEPRSGYQDVTIETNRGQIVIELDLAKAPCTSASFAYLASKGFYNGSPCSRVLDESTVDQTTSLPAAYHIVQCGDPSGTGMGGPTYTFGDENLPTNQRPAYPAGVVAMANTGAANSNGSQFFIVYGDSTFSANYTIFGRVIKGLDIAAQVGTGGDDGSSQAGGGKPKLALTFTSVTVGPVKQTSSSPAPLPSPSTSGSAAPSGSTSPAASATPSS